MGEKIKNNNIKEYKNWQGSLYKTKHPKIVGVLYILGGLIQLFILLLLSIRGNTDKNEVPIMILSYVFFGLFVFLFIFIGIKYILKSRETNNDKLYIKQSKSKKTHYKQYDKNHKKR